MVAGGAAGLAGPDGQLAGGGGTVGPQETEQLEAQRVSQATQAAGVGADHVLAVGERTGHGGTVASPRSLCKGLFGLCERPIPGLGDPVKTSIFRGTTKSLLRFSGRNDYELRPRVGAPGRPTLRVMTFTETMDHIAQLFEAIGAVVLLGGLFLSAALSARALRRSGDGALAYQVLRESFGGVILMGLEILVAADLIRTVAVAPTLLNVATLGLIVLIRTFLSFSLEIEIEGVAPWRRAATSGSRHVLRAARRPIDPPFDQPANPA